jgi:hypothetical protein
MEAKMSDYVLELQEDLRLERKRMRLFENLTFAMLGIGHIIALSFAAVLIYKIWIS